MNSKYRKLFYSILLDGIGMISYIFPPFDFVWAFVSAYFMTRLYKNRAGKIAAVISFIEEALPWVDVIPTFTAMWVYTFIFKKGEIDATEVDKIEG